MARLLVDEARKEAFDASGDAPDVDTRFRAHVVGAFGPGVEFHVVRDHRGALTQHARDLASVDPPVTSLILFATVLEHWINALLVSAYRRSGQDQRDAEVAIRHFTAEKKLKWLHSRFGLPSFSDDKRAKLSQLLERRNAVVHYKWTGRTNDALRTHEADIRESVADSDSLIESFQEYDDRNFAGVGLRVATAIFGVPPDVIRRRAILRGV